MIEIFVDQISERLIYTLDFVIKERGIDYKLNNDFHTFEKSSNFRLNYSERNFENIAQLIPSSLLFDEEIREYQIGLAHFEQEECLTINGKLDPLAAIFYVLSRLEEYTSIKEDNHGRFAAKFSHLFKFGLLHKVVCDRWSKAFLEWLGNRTGFDHLEESYKVAIKPTFDIDNAYAYQLKGGVRRLLSTAKDVLNSDKERISERKMVLKGAAFDPYDTYDYIEKIVERGFDVNVFWLLGDYAKFDKNISYKNVHHQKLIKRLSTFTTVGLHPSYKSNSYEYYLLNEKERLEFILDRNIEHSRQHFLMLKVKQTYPILVSQGFKHDYSMGYADQVGFRAGTARPFYWFDLQSNTKTGLLIHPFAYMDGTLNEYLHLSPDESKLKIKELFDEVKKFGGDLSFIWHNETIGNYGKWLGWKDVLEYTLSLKENQ